VILESRVGFRTMKRRAAVPLICSCLVVTIALVCARATRAQSGGPPMPAAPSAPSPIPHEVLQDSLRLARQLMKEREFDRTIDLLKRTISASTGQPDLMREASLQLIKTYVIMGNEFKLKRDGREQLLLNHEEAKRWISRTLHRPEFRHLQLESTGDYPPEMTALFKEVRQEEFGSFRATLDPPDAAITLDGKVLPHAGTGVVFEADLDAVEKGGRHTVVVQAPKRREVREEIQIPRGGVLECSYQLSRPGRPKWLIVSGLVAAGAIAGVIAGNNTAPPPETPAASDLPSPPKKP